MLYCSLLQRSSALISSYRNCIQQLLYCIVIAVQQGIIAAVCCCVCEMVAFHRGICTFGASFCPQAELRVGGKLSADTCNTCSTRCCLGIELIDFWFQSFVTLNGIAELAQHCGTSLKIKLSTIVFFTACRQFFTQGSTVSAEKSIVLSLSSASSSKLATSAHVLC